MDDLQSALGSISSIRRQVAENTQFRGYGPATLAGTAALAVMGAAVQAAWVPDPASHAARYLGVWMTTAALSAALAGAQMYTRTRRVHSGLSHEMLRMAVEQSVPAAAAGLLLTAVLVHFVPAGLWMLPGLWQVVYSLGIFASCRFLPRQMVAAAAWYLLTGLVALALGDARALAPWTMAVSFGVGQFLVAGVLLAAAPGPAPDAAWEADDEV